MLKGIETEETRLFCHIFIIGGISIGGGGRASCPPGYAYESKLNHLGGEAPLLGLRGVVLHSRSASIVKLSPNSDLGVNSRSHF